MRIVRWLELVSGLAAATVGIFTANKLVWTLLTHDLKPPVAALMVVGMLAWVVGVISAVAHSQTARTSWKISLSVCAAVLLVATGLTPYPPTSVGFFAALALLVTTAFAFVPPGTRVSTTS